MGDPSLRSGRQEKRRRSLTKGFRDDTSGRLGREHPFPLCHSEMILRGVSSVELRGLDITPSRLPQENIKRGDSSSQSALVRMTCFYECLSGKRRRSFASLRTTKIRSVVKGAKPSFQYRFPSSNSTQKGIGGITLF